MKQFEYINSIWEHIKIWDIIEEWKIGDIIWDWKAKITVPPVWQIFKIELSDDEMSNDLWLEPYADIFILEDWVVDVKKISNWMVEYLKDDLEIKKWNSIELHLSKYDGQFIWWNNIFLKVNNKLINTSIKNIK